MLVDPAQIDLLAGGHDHAGVGRPALPADLFCRGPSRRPDRTVRCSRAVSLGSSGLGRCAAVRSGVEEQQRVAFLDTNPDVSAGEDLGASTYPLSQSNHPSTGQGPVDLHDCAVRSTARPGVEANGDSPAGAAPCAMSVSRSLTVNFERSDFTRCPPMGRCTHSQSIRNCTTWPVRAGLSQNWFARKHHVSRTRHHPIEMGAQCDRSASPPISQRDTSPARTSCAELIARW
jgi:hypothetical protein